MKIEKQLAYSLTRAEWEGVCAEWGVQKFRATQIWQGLQVALAERWEDVKGLPGELRGRLEEGFEIGALEVAEVEGKGTRKFLLKCRDGACVEAVLIPSGSGRKTLCVSARCCGIFHRF